MHGLAPQSVRGRIKGCLFLNKLTKKEKIMESRKPGIRGKGGGGVTKVWSLWGRKCLSKISNPPSYPLYLPLKSLPPVLIFSTPILSSLTVLKYSYRHIPPIKNKSRLCSKTCGDKILKEKMMSQKSSETS